MVSFFLHLDSIFPITEVISLKKKKQAKQKLCSLVPASRTPSLFGLIVPNVTSKSPFVTRSIFHNPLLTLRSGSFTASATFRYGRICPLIRPWLRARPRLGLGLRRGQRNGSGSTEKAGPGRGVS